MYKRVIIGLGFLFFSVSVFAQSNLRTKSISLSSDTVLIDTVSIVPGTLSIKDALEQIVKTEYSTIDYPKALLIWKRKPVVYPLKITYKVFPFLFTRKYFNKDIGLINEESIKNSKTYTYQPTLQQNTLFNFKELNKSGSISRSVGVGNAQDLSVNYSMNLKLS